ncbi:MAG: hypothetical protein ACFFDS_02525 [Candidatus Thorarchaeota archaeon]
MNNSEEKEPIPRPGSVEYKFLFGTDEEKQRILKNWKRMNKIFTIPIHRNCFFTRNCLIYNN